ncbi:hypothetical protein K3495_g7016 [Podosphaera aphanis]|nr:hypothetical protein K3495_g7016 [Podosphaera aphanis]
MFRALQAHHGNELHLDVYISLSCLSYSHLLYEVDALSWNPSPNRSQHKEAMVVFFDLEDGKALPTEQYLADNKNVKALRDLNIAGRGRFRNEVVLNHDEKRENPNREKAITKALSCYPIVREIAAHIDLNSLDALSSTCRQVRVNLLQFHSHLINSTLHCENDMMRNGPNRQGYHARVNQGEHVSSACPRDLVDSCQRCDRIICRNCAIKPPARHLLNSRHRRLCRTCTRRDLATLIFPSTNPPPMISEFHVCNCSSDRIWLCRCCGRSIYSADEEYRNIWKWRIRYLSSHGGIGTGIGEGDRGVPCGRGEECANAREVEQEIDCDAEDAREINYQFKSGDLPTHARSHAGSQMGPGYTRHEIEGIGGVMKKKLVKMVKVGACVPELRYEEDVGSFLNWEQDKKSRSWCAWCWKFIPSADDLATS